MVTVKAIYRDGRIIFHNPKDAPEDGTEVTISYLKRSKASVPSLRGSWVRYLPKDFDLDEELSKIRKEWEEDIAGLNK